MPKLQNWQSLAWDDRQTDLTGYIDGPFMASSSWVIQYGFWAQGGQGGILITFNGGVKCWYPGTSPDLYDQLCSAPSKGGWVHDNIYSTPYILIGGGAEFGIGGANAGSLGGMQGFD